jgi:hypothetical protein
MSRQKGLTTWVIRTSTWAVAYRWNMNVRQASRTFSVLRGRRTVVAVGPLIFEW